MAALLRSASRDCAANQPSRGGDVHAMARQQAPPTSSPLAHQSRSHGNFGSSSNSAGTSTSSESISSAANSGIGQPRANTHASEVVEASAGSGIASSSTRHISTSNTDSSQTGGSHAEDGTTRQLRADLVATRAALAQHNAVVRRASARIAALEAENQRCVEQLVQEREIRAKQARLIERLTAAMAGGGERHSSTSDASSASAASSVAASASSAPSSAAPFHKSA
jgi:hypothetical protein